MQAVETKADVTREIDTAQTSGNIKKLWIIHHYATLPNLNGHIRPYRFAQYLKKHSIETIILASSYQHFSGKNLITDEQKYLELNADDIPFVFINTPSGVSGAARVKNMLGFYTGLMKNYKKLVEKYGKPDIILASSPQPLGMAAGVKIAKKLGVPCICEVRDLWPEAIFTATSVAEKSILGRILTAGEHWIYKRAAALIFTKEGDTDYLKEHDWTMTQGGDIDLSKCYYINNGIDLNSYRREITENAIADPDLDADTFKIIYAGAIRSVNNVENIIDAAKLVRNPRVQFLIYGDGNQKTELEERVLNEGITNVKFKGFVEKKYIPYILSRASVNLLNYSDTKYNWSRGNSSNKLFEYMASGKPVISTVKMGYSIVNKYHCGTELEVCTPDALADAVERFIAIDKGEYDSYCDGASEGAKEFDYAVLTERLFKVIQSTLLETVVKV